MFKRQTANTHASTRLILPITLIGIVFCVLSCQLETTANAPLLVFDFDLDGVADPEDLDDDNDGIPDEIETSTDLDEDKVPNHQDRDSDGDGVNDLIEALGVDKDGDGMIDPWDEWVDGNKNGFHDEYEAEPLVVQTMEGDKQRWGNRKDFIGISLDVDLDQVPNFWDLDSDNDGLSDFQEWANSSQHTKLVDTNADGFNDELVGHIYTQGDKELRSGHPEPSNEELGVYQSIYASIGTGVLKGNPAIDENGNGIPNFFDKQKN
jgi:hypothetical protein